MSAAASAVVLLRVDREAGRHTAHPRHLHPALDLKYIQAGLEAALRAPVPLLDGWLGRFSVDDFVARALATRPRYAVIRGVTWCIAEAVSVASRLRAAGVVTIGIGQQVQHFARAGFEGWEAAYDLAIPGEAEEEVPRVLLRLLAGEDLAALRADWKRRAAGGELVLVRDPDALNAPRVGRKEMGDYAFPFPVHRGGPVSRWGYVLSAWGCPRPCRHCTAIVRKSVGRDLRTRAASAVVDEVLALRDEGAQAVSFEDDSLLVHRPRFLQLADEFVRRGVRMPWMANARPDELDAERVAAASAAGAALLKIGVDSGSARLIERLGKTGDGDGWLRATEAGFARLAEAGIGSVALFMIGMPGESVADAQASLALARSIRPDYVQVQRYQAYPDVPMWDELPEAARVRHDGYHYLASNANCSRIPERELAALQGAFYRQFYLRPGFAFRHLRKYWRHYLSPATLTRLPATLAYLLRG